MRAGLSSDQRLAVAALIDRLIYGDSLTFSVADAAEINRIIPAASRGDRLSGLLPSIHYRGRHTGRGLEGAMAGGRGVGRMEGEERTVEFDTRGLPVFRVGQWKVTRPEGLSDALFGRSVLEIEQVLSTAEDEERMAARLLFRRGRPRLLERHVERAVHFGEATFAFGMFRPWKRPADGGSP